VPCILLPVPGRSRGRTVLVITRRQRALAKHGDNAVEDGYGDDEDADERLVCVLHYKSIFKGRE
jgi:hypothetical protein